MGYYAAEDEVEKREPGVAVSSPGCMKCKNMQYFVQFRAILFIISLCNTYWPNYCGLLCVIFVVQ